jgi:acetyl-CoA synthetase
MTTIKTYEVSAETASRALIDKTGYDEMYKRSVEDNEGFWAEQAERIDWIKPFTKVKDVSWAKDDVHIRWYYDGTLNVCYNCVDRHLETKGDDVAIIWEGDDPARDLTITYRELHLRVCKFANALKKLGAKKGDRITIYMPMIPEAAVAMLACSRIGAVHSVVFGGFSPDALAGRIHDCNSNIVITADQGMRGAKAIPLKDNVDAAAQHPEVKTLEKVLVVRNTGADVDWVAGRDAWLHDLEAEVEADCPCEEMGAEDPLFILYTSGSTGKPKGEIGRAHV